ncbi:MAG TPA: hypothetical protein VIW19_12220 [Gaiellaceae bacterium]
MPDEESRKSGFLTFWTTLPGILTGLAALITAVVGALALFKTSDNGNHKGVDTGTPVTINVSHSQSKSSGRLSLVSGDPADLETGQIGQSIDADVAFGPETTPTLGATPSASLAPVDTRPTRAECAAALRARHDGAEIVSRVERKWICVSTAEKNIAVVRILSAPGPGSAKLVLGYTAWR